MANELKHDDIGTSLTKAEWEGIGTHIFDSQATGDLAYASSDSQLRRLAIGATDTILSVQGGIPAWRTPANILTDLSGQAGAPFDWNSQNLTGVASLTATGLTVNGASSLDGAVTINETGADVDFRVEGNTNPNLFVVDASQDALWVGQAPSAFGAKRFSVVFIDQSFTADANQPMTRFLIAGDNAITIPAGTAATATSLWVQEPNIIATGTVTLAASLYVSSAPTEGATNAAIYVGGGDTNLVTLTMRGDINPDGDGTRDLGTQTTAQWANVWSDLINGADIMMANKWRMIESELFEGYPKGWAIGHDGAWIDGKSLWVNPHLVGNAKPVFVVTDDFIEYKGRRITTEILDKVIELALV
ncbi:hypothetical protein CMI37_13925 [Candidatus Pacearchaeota archaeon]|nr:hypothetical protein [Candidatus Pacearchaeota archaeon]|tara:strand:- start:2400 stop:3479 length:1080 start_codon:yes stop_codon:yes gene_type:complete